MKQTIEERMALCLSHALRCISEARYAFVDASFYRTFNRADKERRALRKHTRELRRARRWLKRADALKESER